MKIPPSNIRVKVGCVYKTIILLHLKMQIQE